MAKKSKWEGNTRKNPTRTIRVESGTVYVVPFPFARTYFGFEIEDEGFYRSGCHPVVLLPRHEAGQATREWVEAIFAAMDEVRRIHPGRPSKQRGFPRSAEESMWASSIFPSRFVGRLSSSPRP